MATPALISLGLRKALLENLMKAVAYKIYQEIIIPWMTLFISTLILVCLIVTIVLLKELNFFTILAIFTMVSIHILFWFFYGQFVVEMDNQVIKFGFRFMGREWVPFSLIDYAEILNLEDGNTAVRFLLQKAIPPVIFGGYHRLPGSIIRLRLKRVLSTHYKFRRKEFVKHFLFSSRRPEQILWLLSQNGVSVQKKRVKQDEFYKPGESL